MFFVVNCYQPAVASIFGKDADGFVKTCRHKLLSSWGIVDVEHSGDMVHVHHDWPAQGPHVICVQTDKDERY